MRRLPGFLLLAAWLVSATVVVRAEIIDRILAVVEGAIVMQSDVAAAVRLGLVPAAGAPDPVAAALDALWPQDAPMSGLVVTRYGAVPPAFAALQAGAGARRAHRAPADPLRGRSLRSAGSV